MNKKTFLYNIFASLFLTYIFAILLPHLGHADFYGTIKSPTGTFGKNPGADVGNLIGFGIKTTFIIAGLACLAMMLMGAVSWITSGGEQEKLQKAQKRIRNAVVGFFMVIVMFGLFVVVFGIVLNNKVIDMRGGFRFGIPTLNPQCPPGSPTYPNC